MTVSATLFVAVYPYARQKFIRFHFGRDKHQMNSEQNLNGRSRLGIRTTRNTIFAGTREPWATKNLAHQVIRSIHVQGKNTEWSPRPSGYSDVQTKVLLRPVAGLCSEGFVFRFLVIQNECPEGTNACSPGKLLKVRCSEMQSGAFWVIKSVEML